jgi:dolichol-phosphate mannosyltransferase
MVEMIAAVIPAYRVKNKILDVISGIGSEVHKIYVIDDKCPDESGLFVQQNCKDNRVQVIFHDKNKGVGGAVKSGYRKALTDNCNIVVKIDGDGQMDTSLIPQFIHPIIIGEADYVKGNRFFNLSSLSRMPGIRVFGNSMLSIINKFVNGYWNIMDPTNGFTAIHRTALSFLELDKISDTYFFESDMLFRLGTIRAVVYDIPMHAKYADEESSLNIAIILFQFPLKYLTRYFKRIFYNYFLRDFNAGTIELIVGSLLFIFGVIEGLYHWIQSIESHIAATSGTVMLAALPTILGFQLLISGLQYDIRNLPVKPLQKLSL